MRQDDIDGHMKPKILFLILSLLMPLRLPAQPNQPSFRLVGIIDIPQGMKKALVESKDRPMMLAEGESVSQAVGSLKVENIDLKRRIVEGKINGTAGTLILNLLDTTHDPKSEPTIILEQASLKLVLELYSDFAGRTLLRHPLIHDTEFTFRARALDRPDVAHAFEKALTEKGIVVMPDGDIFTMLVPKRIDNTIKAGGFNIKNDTKSPRDISYDFPDLPLQQAADIYAELLCGCGMNWNESFPRVAKDTIQLHTEAPLTREEARYALGTLFSWAGVNLVPAGQNLMKAVAIDQKISDDKSKF